MKIDIKIDYSSLPKDGQEVLWQTHEDENNGEWKEGIFSMDETEGLFLYDLSKEQTTNKWNTMWEVIHWKPIKNSDKNSIVASLPKEKQYYITLMSWLFSELENSKIITPTQKKQAIGYLEVNVQKNK